MLGSTRPRALGRVLDCHSACPVVFQSQALEPGATLGDYSPSGVYEARAYAHIKLQQWMEAVQDASKAIELDPSNIKAYLRKGCAPSKLVSSVTYMLVCLDGC